MPIMIGNYFCHGLFTPADNHFLASLHLKQNL